MSLDQLENAVANLPSEELARFRVWFAEFDAEAWDEQIVRDVQKGQLDAVARKSIESHQAGESREI